jgi:hypothetical protein
MPIKRLLALWLSLIALACSFSAWAGTLRVVVLVRVEQDTAPGSLRALSLRQLQSRLEQCTPADGCDQDATQLGELTHPLGYFIEPKKDVLLFGWQDARRPPIRTDDFVVALRNAWKNAAQSDESFLLTDPPACDIRPDTETVRSMQRFERTFFAETNPKAAEAMLEDWSRICRTPQTVSVMGVPFDSDFARIMVDADYDMKTLADGTASTRTPGLLGVGELHMSVARAQVATGQPTRMGTSMNRYWLNAEKPRTLESEHGFVIREAAVRIDTRPIGLSVGGELEDMVGQDPQAQEFARRFTETYAKVAQKQPIYAELENLFQLSALSLGMRSRAAHTAAELNLDYLLSRHNVRKVQVRRRVEGRDALRQHVQLRAEDADTVRTSVLHMPSCGGVAMSVQLPARRRAERWALLPLLSAAYASRAEAKELSAIIDDAAAVDSVVALMQQRRLDAFARANPNAYAIHVRDLGSSYRMQLPSALARQAGLSELRSEVSLDLVKLAEVLLKSDRALVYLKLAGLAEAKVLAFYEQLAQRTLIQEAGARLVLTEQPTRLRDELFFEAGMDLADLSTGVLTGGNRQLSAQLRVSDEQRLRLSFVASDAAALETLHKMWGAEFYPAESSARRPADIAAEALMQMVPRSDWRFIVEQLDSQVISDNWKRRRTRHVAAH